MIPLVDLYAISLIEGVGEGTLRKIISNEFSVRDLRNGGASIENLFHKRNSYELFLKDYEQYQEKAFQQISYFQDQGIEVIHCLSEAYPPNLRLLEDFPLFLYCRGNLELLKSRNNIAVIGTRENSEVGGNIARGTARFFAQSGYTIVSGLAKGIDAIGHQAALDAGGKTIAVLIDVQKVYPKENQPLAQDILKKEGLLIAENRPGSFQGKNAFVLRDRIQSGLSLAIFPIETDVKGGTMHTVGYARKQKRLTYVPDLYHAGIKELYGRHVGLHFSKIKGIKELIDTQQAKAYARDNYPQILQELTHQKELLIERTQFLPWAKAAQTKESASESEAFSVSPLSTETPSPLFPVAEPHVEDVCEDRGAQEANVLEAIPPQAVQPASSISGENTAAPLTNPGFERSALTALEAQEADLKKRLEEATDLIKQLKKELKDLEKQKAALVKAPTRKASRKKAGGITQKNSGELTLFL